MASLTWCWTSTIKPLIDLEVPPLGYVRTRGQSEGLTGEIERLGTWIGTVNKPRFFTFDERLCAFDRQGVEGCRRCLSACPAGALDVGSGAIRIDPFLCQGCGGCTLACPTGAVRYARPRPATTLGRVFEALQGAGDEIPPPLVIHAGPRSVLGIPDRVADLEVPSIGTLGPEIWFGALAMGASRVIILASGPLPESIFRLLEAEVELARRQLSASGQAPERIRLARDAAGIDWGGLPNPWPRLDLTDLGRERTKRGQINAALMHQSRHPEGHRSAQMLADGATFGTLLLAQMRCTLCMACVGLCPTGALRKREGALAFAPSDCVQCGLCARACPEKALELNPGFDGDPDSLTGEQVLKGASEWFHCISCCAPFARRSLVEGSMAHVQHHPMFQGEGRQLLQMCMSCRQKATLGVA
jgi:ferredoxin